MKNIDDGELERFIQGWHYNKKSHVMARHLGSFFFDFIDSLEDAQLSRSTVKKHWNNCWAIGFLECQYGIHNKTSIAIEQFKSGDAMHEYEFERKFSDSNYALKSYASTWRKLAKFFRTYEFKERLKDQGGHFSDK